MSPKAKPAIAFDWAMIDTVLVDLDGTLLDLGFDNRFWLERIPAAYAAARGLPLDVAREVLAPRFRAYEGTLPWYCIEHWTRELELDVVALKRGCAAEVAWLPGAREFLTQVRAAGKRQLLLTNAHPVVLAIKEERTGVSSYLDALYSSHQFGAAKEDPRFWSAVQEHAGYDPRRALFIDDSPRVLDAAAASGIRFVCGIRCPDLSGTYRDHGSRHAVDSIVELLAAPGLRPAA
jgi:5'-nucleotidase